jgi:predicted DNA-binding transcriptional regulator AlpA
MNGSTSMMGAAMTRRAADPLVPPPELATELGVPVKTLAEWRSRGLGPSYVRVGRHVRYRREAINLWLDAQTHRTEKTAV